MLSARGPASRRGWEQSGLSAVPLSAKQIPVDGKVSVLKREQSSLLSEEDCLALLFLMFFPPFFYLNANNLILMTPHPFIFYTILMFPIPSAFKAAEGMQLTFLTC